MVLKTQHSFSIFFPCYNDQESIQILVRDAFSILKSLTKNRYEVIVIDDHSYDDSYKILKQLQLKYPNLKVYRHKKNKGYGGALISGFKRARYDLIFYTDGDGQYDVKELPILLQLMSRDVNFVNGIKMSRNDATIRIVLGNFYSFIARWLFWLPIHDVDCDFRLIRRSLIKKLDLKKSSGAICIELVKKAQTQGGKFRQVSVHHYERQYGSSQFFRPKRLLNTFQDLLSLWVELKFKS